MNQNKLANGLLTCSWATSIRHSYHVIVLDVHCFWSENCRGIRFCLNFLMSYFLRDIQTLYVFQVL